MGSFKGISHELSPGRRSYTAAWGFRGIVQELVTTLRFIKVTDYKGVPLQGVNVTVNNPGLPLTTITNQSGIAEILPNTGVTLTIDLKQYSMELIGTSYTTNTEPITRTIILDTIIPHL